jgi:hypothetical protein
VIVEQVAVEVVFHQQQREEDGEEGQVGLGPMLEDA